MISKIDVLLIFRAVFTLAICLSTLAFIAVFTLPFLGTGESYHRMLIENSWIIFVLIRLGMLIVALSISSALLYIIGRLCQKNTSWYAYITLFILSLTLSISLTVYFLNEFLWCYVPD